ncbi:MAG: hypothetical protein JG777_2031 [Clostridia bacterium]|nr:hypothetical protein [Clostridia bacterium]
MRLGDGSSVECAFHATEEPSPCRHGPHVEALSNQAYFHHYLCRVRPAWQLI